MRISTPLFMQVPNWLAGTFEKLVPVSWFTSGSQILYSRRVQGNWNRNYTLKQRRNLMAQKVLEPGFYFQQMRLLDLG